MSIPAEYEHQRVGAEGYRVLALDLDGVCADYTQGIRNFLVEQGSASAADLPDPDVYNLSKASGWPFENIEDYLTTHKHAVAEGLYRKLPLIPGASEALQRLAKEKVHIRVLTHRLFTGGLHQRVVSDTVAWLDDHKIPYMSICFTGLKDTIDANIYIDDAPANVKVLQEAGKDVILFNQSYNKELELDGVRRVFDWDEAANEILKTLN